MSLDAATRLAEVEAALRGFLANAAGKLDVGFEVAPSSPSPDWRDGFRVGSDAEAVAMLSLALSVVTGQSPKEVADNAMLQAKGDRQVPFVVHVDEVEAA